MKEDFLHFIWKMQLFQPIQLRTIYNEKIKVLKPGIENSNEGPDFLNASIEVESQLWAGHVEIHVKSSDWYVHLHQLDANYNATILHVVWEYDVPVYSPANVEIPALEIKSFISETLLHTYRALFQKQQKWIYCENLIGSLDSFKIDKWLEALYFERLQVKVEKIKSMLVESTTNWEEVLFWMLARNFGLKINAANFLEVAQSVPFHVVRKQSSSNGSLEALFFGQAGLLLDEKNDNEYYLKLKQEYNFLKSKYKLREPLKRRVNFFRLRPVSFPTIRLSQLAELYGKHGSLFRDLMESTSLEEIRAVFKVKASDFWRNHYTFDTDSSNIKDKYLSHNFVDLLIINTVLPLKFMYKTDLNNAGFKTQIDILENLKPEKNSIVSKFKNLNVIAKNAMQSQGLIQLKTEYCEKGKCLSCVFGKEFLKNQS